MADFGLPPGVSQRTGVLVHRASDVTTAGLSAVETFSVDVGPGFVVGVLGAVFSTLALAGDGVSSDQGWSVDPDRTAWSDTAADIVVSMSISQELITSGLAQQKSLAIMLPGPVLTTRDLVYVTRAGTANADLKSTLYYAIFEVTDAQFLRIAGISLSRS